MPDEPQHCIRDGDYRLIYVVGKKGLYKFFPDGNYIAMMKPVDVDAGEKGLMVGYGQLITFPPAGGVRILVPTRDTSPGGLWVLDGTWKLKNGAGGTNALPTGWEWFKVAASPQSGNVITMIGHGAGDISATAQWPDGVLIDTDSGLSPMWQTADGGDHWFPVTMPTPYLYSSGASVRFSNARDGLWLTYSNDNKLLVFAKIKGIGAGDFYPGLAQWWGPSAALQVRGSAWDGTTAQGPAYFGDTDVVDAYSLTFGIDGEAVVSAFWGNRAGSNPGGIAYTLPDPLDPTHTTVITGANYVGATNHGINWLDRMLTQDTGVVGVGSDGVYYTPDYRNDEMTLLVANTEVDPGNVFKSSVATGQGIFVNGSGGIYQIQDVGSPTPVLGTAATVGFLVASRQVARQIVVGRKPWTDVLDGTFVAQFMVYDGDSWTTVDGPTDSEGRNAKLSISALAVTEG